MNYLAQAIAVPTSLNFLSNCIFNGSKPSLSVNINVSTRLIKFRSIDIDPIYLGKQINYRTRLWNNITKKVRL